MKTTRLDGWNSAKFVSSRRGDVRGKQFKKQLLNITALMTRLERNFPCPYLFVECRNESYSEPHCTISENLAAKVLK